MTNSDSSGPPPHERGLSAGEKQILAGAEPNYEVCVIRRNYDMRNRQVWFTAHSGQRVVGRSRLCDHASILVGGLKRFDKDVKGAYAALVKTLLDNGWESTGTDKTGLIVTMRRAIKS